MQPILVTVVGKVIEFGDIYDISPGRKAQRVLVERRYEDVRFKADVIAIFVYGNDIWKLVESYKNEYANCNAEFICRLSGRMNNNRNTLTLSFKKVTWNH
jgi:hypothetical protein